MNIIKINVEYLKIANYALFHNSIPICQAVEITNESERPYEDIRVACVGEYISQYESELISTINPNETIVIRPFELKPDASKLTSLTERIVTNFKITVANSEEIIEEKTFEIELMPYDHWTGTRILPQTIASFITPNHPSINNIVLKAAEFLKQISGSSTLKEYQTGNINDVRQQVIAIFAAIHDLGIVYRSLPASYERIGQRITMPDQVINSKIGNCLELTLLIASALEAIGINCVIIFKTGHAYLGVWLVDDCYPCSVCDDQAFIEKKCSAGIEEMMVIECTQVVQENASFQTACLIAQQNLADRDSFELFVDIKRSRLEQIRPLPSRVVDNGVWSFVADGIDHGQCATDVKETDRYDLSKISATNKELTKYDIWERKLLDFSLRNQLLNLSLRRRAIQFISFDINRIEDHLQDGKEYSITSKPNVELQLQANQSIERSKIHSQIHELISNDIEHHLLHTYFTEAETNSVLKNIYRAARNAIEETGANSLFLAIGALRWFETKESKTPRYAPLLLLPVEMVYKKGSYYIRTRDEDITLNITLIEFLRQNYDIKIEGLNPLPLDDSGVDVPLIFAIIRDALKEQKQWDVEEECVLGTFSFSKFLMWNDIHSHREKLAENDIINSLVEGRLSWTPTPIASTLNDIDVSVSPVDTALPVPVDSSQMAAVIEGGNGNSFILYGPPGTGKSQTITNLIANALYHGKRVLFVAEKMAALSVVQSRLEKIGLDPFCLELHSNKATKRHVLQQLDKALKVSHIASPAEFTGQAEKIFSERKDLIAYMKALHTPLPSDGLSLYDCIIRYESIEESPFSKFNFDPAIDDVIRKNGIKGVEDLLGSRFETVIKLVGQPAMHPLNGLFVDREMLMNSRGFAMQMEKDAASLSAYSDEISNLKNAKRLKEKLLRDNTGDIFNEDAEALRQQWREAKAKWFIPRFFAKQKFIKQLRLYNQHITAEEVDSLIEELINYRQMHDSIIILQQIIRHYFNIEYGEDELPEKSCITDSSAKLSQWSTHASEMRDWLHWVEFSNELRASGLGCIVDALQAEEQNVSCIKEAFLKALFKYKAEEIISHSDILATFEGMIFDEKTAAYKQMTEEFQRLTQKELYARLAASVPRMTDNVVNGSEIGLLNRNISNGGRGQSLRDLFDHLPTILPRLCPCMLMSPMSVAQYIDLTADKFDLVIFDEASQMPTSEAVGAIARGKALIVVGDPKQMPPTSFFTSTNVDEEEACIDDMESILEDCRTLDMPSLQLSWHYRSRHESLIAFSNNEYYDGSLITFPSVDDQRTKVHYIPVTGHYEKGGKRCNRAEAEAIVNEIVRRLKNENLHKFSIGVIAFSVMQQGLIEDILQEKLDKDKSLQEAASALYEPIFIKNLENVQGDERDVILFSIGYGPDKDGKVSMNFGPLNNAGGERRLNVAVSRARQEMYIYSTLKSADIDLRRSKARGVEGLKHFLRYAETQLLPTSSLASANHQSSLIADMIAVELRKQGYSVTTNVGRSKFRVDVAVENEDNPGTYSLGILLDGKSYRDTHTTRDREVVQPSVLHNLKWKTMRVWSVDWFNNKERVINRIIERINEITNMDADGAEEEVPTQPETFDITTENVVETEVESKAKDYTQYMVDSQKAFDMGYAELMREVIAMEQPITFIYLCRRVNSLLLGSRVTPKFQRTLQIYTDRFFTDDSGTLWLSQEDSRDYSFYRPNSGRDITEIPEIEVINAITEALIEQVALNQDNLTLVAAKKLGFTRRGTNVDAAFTKAIVTMKEKGLLERAGDENLRLSTLR